MGILDELLIANILADNQKQEDKAEDKQVVEDMKDFMEFSEIRC